MTVCLSQDILSRNGPNSLLPHIGGIWKCSKLTETAQSSANGRESAPLAFRGNILGPILPDSSEGHTVRWSLLLAAVAASSRLHHQLSGSPSPSHHPHSAAESACTHVLPSGSTVDRGRQTLHHVTESLLLYILKSSFFSRKNDSMSPKKFIEFSLLCSHLALTLSFLLFMEYRGLWQENLVSPFGFWVCQHLHVPKAAHPHTALPDTHLRHPPALSSPDSFPFLHPGIPSVSH